MAVLESVLSERNILRSTRMIFVTVGNATQGFPRLLEAIDEIAGNGTLKQETFVVQSGSNFGFRARHCAQRGFFSPDEFRELIDQADVIVCHGGAGTLHHVFSAGKVPVVMPRRRKYHEHVDDQYALVKALADHGRVIPAFETTDLSAAIEIARERHESMAPPSLSTALGIIERAINELFTSSQ